MKLYLNKFFVSLIVAGSMILSSSSTSHAIINGSPANAKDYKSFVQVEGCGGVLIAKDIVLTAAHCACRFAKSGSVIVGSDKLNVVTRGAQKRDIVPGWYAIHPESPYNHHGSFDYPNCLNQSHGAGDMDFMLIKIQPVTKRTIIRKIPTLYKSTKVSTRKKLKAVGFGTKVHNPFAGPDEDVFRETLYHAEFKAHSDKTCEDIWESEPFIDYNKKSTFCVSNKKNYCTSVSYGDSGGPIYDRKRKKVVGIASYVELECDSNTRPIVSVFSRVSYVSDWIENTVCELSDYAPATCPKD